MSFYTNIKSMIDEAIANPVLSRDHHFTQSEVEDYDSLNHRGRRLYDNLRTQFNWTHGDSMWAAVDRFGYKEKA